MAGNFVKKYLLDLILITSLVATVFFLSSKWIEPIEEWGGDYAGYLSQGISLSRGEAEEYVADNALSIELSDRVVGPITYPWGYPIIIAIVYGLGRGMLTLKWLSALFFSSFIVTTWLGFRKDHSRLALLIICLFIMLNTQIQSSIGSIGSDIPFMFFSTLSLVLIGRSKDKQGNVFLAAIIGLLIAVSYLIRSQGLLLLATLLSIQGIELVRKYIVDKKISKQLILRIIAEVTVFGLVVLIAESILPSRGSYLDVLVSVDAQFIWEQVSYYFDLFRNVFIAFPYQGAIFGLSVILFVTGIALSLRERAHLAIYFILSIAMLIVWPFQQGLRFVFPILIVYLSLIMFALEFGFSKLLGKYKTIPLVLVLAAVGFFLGGDTISVLENRATYFGQTPKGTPYSVEAQEVFKWSRDNIEEGDIVIFFKPRVFRYQTGLDSISITQPENIHRGDYLVEYLYEDTRNWQLSDVEISSLQDERVLIPVFSSTKYNVYSIGNRD